MTPRTRPLASDAPWRQESQRVPRLPRNTTAATLSQFVICGILRQPLLARQPLAAERLAQRVQQVVIDQFDELRALAIGLWQSFDAAAAVRMPSILQDASAICKRVAARRTHQEWYAAEQDS